jgi:hypothetical protein
MHALNSFVEGMKEIGCVEGRDIDIVSRYAGESQSEMQQSDATSDAEIASHASLRLF